MNVRTIAAAAVLMLPLCAGAGPVDLTQDLGGLDVAVILVPRDNPDGMRIDNKTGKIISCSANFTGADQNQTVRVTVEPGKSATVRIPHARGGTTRTAELKCREKAPDRK